ncbi:MAG: hypothetical protein ACLSHA_11745 [Neglectibacter timonensis]
MRRHYEPLRKVINLTKMHGAGSLAHEWWHGFDDYLGSQMGAKSFLSEQPRRYPLFQKLIDTMKYKSETPEQAAARTKAQTERTRKNAASWLDSAVLGSLKRYGNEARWRPMRCCGGVSGRRTRLRGTDQRF